MAGIACSPGSPCTEWFDAPALEPPVNSSRFATRFGDASKEVKLVVGTHADQIGHAIRKREERGDRADVPDVLVGEAMCLELLVVGVDELDRSQRNLEREVEHRFLPLGDVRLAEVDRDLVRDERVLGVDA